MTPDIKALTKLAAKIGHRSDAGFHCHSLSSLLSIDPEHPHHADRHKDLLIVQRDGLKAALSDLSSHDQRPDSRDQAQQTTGVRS